ncbi:13077_t:CDS:2, partial [Dentiscutata heterogama]
MSRLYDVDIGSTEDVGINSISCIKVMNSIDVGSIKDMSSGIKVSGTSVGVLDDSISCIKVMSGIDISSIKDMSSSIEVGGTSVGVLND